MKNTTAILFVIVLGVGLIATGCATTGGDDERFEVAKCPDCGTQMAEGTFCAGCNTVSTTYGEFTCENCAKKVKAGTWCAKHNKFHFPKDAPRCKMCGKLTGEWCEKCGHYAGLPKVSYDKANNRPVAKAQ